MRISDWSSDVCSSDLSVARRRRRFLSQERCALLWQPLSPWQGAWGGGGGWGGGPQRLPGRQQADGKPQRDPLASEVLHQAAAVEERGGEAEDQQHEEHRPALLLGSPGLPGLPSRQQQEGGEEQGRRQAALEMVGQRQVDRKSVCRERVCQYV